MNIKSLKIAEPIKEKLLFTLNYFQRLNKKDKTSAIENFYGGGDI